MARTGLPGAGLDPLARAVLGDVETALLENLYAAYQPDALRLARSIVGDPDLAADVVHTAYLQILRSLLSGRRWVDPADAKLAVLRHTRWAAHSALRSRRRLVDLPARIDVLDGDPGLWAQAEARALCELIVGQLKPRHRAAIAARYIDGLSNAAAARRAGITENAFALRLSRALAAARRLAGGSRTAAALWWVEGLRRGGAARGARSQRRIATAAVMPVAGAVALTAVAANALAPSAPGATRPVAATVAPAATPPPASPLPDDRVPGNVVVVDAAVAPQAHGPSVVVAVADDGRCGCWIVLESNDAGASWRSAPAPGLAPTGAHVSLPQGYPTDPRIFLEAPMRSYAAPTFGALFVPSASAPASWPAPYTMVCRCSLPADVGAGFPQVVTGVTVAAADGRNLFFPRSGGELCSADGARTWTSRCAL